MYKATTPTITFNFPDSVDMTQASNVYVTFSTKGGKTLVTKEGSALQIEAQTVAVTFTQAETLDLPAGTICYLYSRWRRNDCGNDRRGVTADSI